MPRPPDDPPERGARRLAARAASAAHARLARRHPIGLEYPPPDTTAARWGWGRPPNEPLRLLLAQSAPRIAETLAAIERRAADLQAIPHQPGRPDQPCWAQHWFAGLDAALLYCLIRERRPRRFHEIGSGNSTLFARRAVADGGLETHILSVDPEPRAEVDAVCDEVTRLRFEDADPAAVADLTAGDVLLVDCSHYVLQGTDVTAFFLDVLPALPAGVLLGVHDVFLPDDYPWWLADRWYSEQYMLAAWLLGGAAGATIVFPTHFACTEPELRARTDAAWSRAGMADDVLAYGSTLWLET